MPTSLLSADSQFPDLEKTQSDKEKFEILSNYLYMLLEQLRYTLSNLGLDNFNASEFLKMGETITGPIYIQLEDDDERLNQLQITAEGLSGRISDTEGNVTALQATSAGLAARISSAEGNITSLQATSAGLAAQISDANGNIASLQATATSLTSRVSDAEGNISVVQQTVNGLTVTDASGTTRIKGSSVETGSLNLTGAITWSDLSSGVQSDINDAVDTADTAYSLARTANTTASDLDDIITEWKYVKNGTTYIDGGMIMVGTIIVDELYGDTIYLYDDAGKTAGTISTTGATSTSKRKIVIKSGAIEFNASDGNVYMESGGGEYLHIQAGGDIVCGLADFVPNNTETWSLGSSLKSWNDIYAVNCACDCSDLNKKHDVVYDITKYDDFFDALRPISFSFNNGKSGRTHIGLGAQDVEQALLDCGLTSMDFAGLVKAEKKDSGGSANEGEYDYFLRYGEFISLLIEQVQKLKTRVARLEGAA